VRRELTRRQSAADIEQIQQDRIVRISLEDLNKPEKADSAAVQLLQWLSQAVGDPE
jgi:predicted ribosome quality control (RQC) complex YloA/Tae2 family protein